MKGKKFKYTHTKLNKLPLRTYDSTNKNNTNKNNKNKNNKKKDNSRKHTKFIIHTK